MTVKTHHLKIATHWADAKLSGEKLFEIRFNDRDYQRGDHVVYRVVNPKTREDVAEHPLNNFETEITHVVAGVDGLEKNWCVFHEAPVTKTTKKETK